MLHADKKATPDMILIIVTFTLLAVGLIMVYSASAVWAEYKFNDSFFLQKAIAFRGCRNNRDVFHYEC